MSEGAEELMKFGAICGLLCLVGMELCWIGLAIQEYKKGTIWLIEAIALPFLLPAMIASIGLWSRFDDARRSRGG